MKCGSKFRVELEEIATWWMENSIDEVNGGFYGEVSNNSIPVATAEKGLVLNARMLWFFSEVAKLLGDRKYQLIADRAFDYLRTHFRDKENGGYWWLVDHLGQPVSRRKQVYGQSFVIYAFCAYYSLTDNKVALEEAMEIFSLLEKNAVDGVHGGYIEAFSESWSPIDDLRLSPQDMNHPKTMNTHLHVLEAYTSLQMVHPSQRHSAALRTVLDYFRTYIIDDRVDHLRMFLDSEWVDQSTSYSYGHDIEASWLIWEAIDVLDDPLLKTEFEPIVLGLADSCFASAVDESGGILDEFDVVSKLRKKEFPWWVQAEALVGFYNAYQITGKRKYLDVFDSVWSFIEEHIKDYENGEWLWFSRICDVSRQNYKAGCWKGPYHNGRAMIEVCKRHVETGFEELEKTA
ncbi:AGE family epimerase/isomerase [Arenicella sp. 4NH20-0111]|uniref:AGE family epimerase/isomerase n=1 Tax=Arenicella sp. 4NH20-0111 TaxID=3127648 RepID=UPI003341622E